MFSSWNPWGFRRASTERTASTFHEFVYDGVMECGAAIRAELFRNIVLAGGSTLFPGMAERLQREISALTASLPATTRQSARQHADYPEVRHGRHCYL